jgi:hypothetical protein
MEKGDKKKKAPKKKVTKKKTEKQPTNQNKQNINLKIHIGAHPTGKKKNEIQGVSRVSKVSTPYIQPPQVIVRNLGDPVQTYASYTPAQINKLIEMKEEPTVKLKKEIITVEKKNDTNNKSTIKDPKYSFRDWLDERKGKEIDSFDRSPLTTVQTKPIQLKVIGAQQSIDDLFHASGSISPIAFSKAGNQSGLVNDSEDEKAGNQSGLVNDSEDENYITTAEISRNLSNYNELMPSSKKSKGGSKVNEALFTNNPHLKSMYDNNEKAAYQRERDRIATHISKYGDSPINFPKARDEIGHKIVHHAHANPPPIGWKDRLGDFQQREEQKIGEGLVANTTAPRYQINNNSDFEEIDDNYADF